jgi:2-polyprenyl-6-methoxyphenol hydroxylase-like FAD-dependent oxidoreductase
VVDLVVDPVEQQSVDDAFPLPEGHVHFLETLRGNLRPQCIDFIRHIVAIVEQNHIERILAEWVGELRVPIYRAREVTGFTQDETGVDVKLSDGQRLRSQYLVGCDGGSV